MTDQALHFDKQRAVPAAAPEVIKWRRQGDMWEGLVSRETAAGQTSAEWVPALPMHDEGDEAQVRRVVARAFRQYGQYHETVEIDDVARVELLGRIGKYLEQVLGRVVGRAAIRQKDGMVRVCLWLAPDALDEDDE